MARYELPIYGENDQIVKTHATNICPWAVYIQAAEMNDKIKDKSAVEQMNEIGNVLKLVFKGLTDDELLCADAGDVISTFKQIAQGGQTINSGKNA